MKEKKLTKIMEKKGYVIEVALEDYILFYKLYDGCAVKISFKILNNKKCDLLRSFVKTENIHNFDYLMKLIAA